MFRIYVYDGYRSYCFIFSSNCKYIYLFVNVARQEAVKKICSWEYVNCIDLWVRFISANIHDYDLQPLMFMTIQIINGLAYLFAGPRYFPLRLKCIQWLSFLSSSSGFFIPVASFVLDILEYKVVKEGGRSRNTFNITSVLKVRDTSFHWYFARCDCFLRCF